MSTGLRLWDAASHLIFDTTDVTFHVLDEIHVNAAGNLTNGDLGLGTPWWLFTPTDGNILGCPSVSFFGTTMYWSQGPIPFSGYLTYGIK